MTTPDPGALRARLRDLLVGRSVRLGDFTLSSGATSGYYVDARRTTMTAEGQALIGRVCLAAIRERGWEADYVGGLTLGADPIAYAVAHASFDTDEAPLDAFTVRKRTKDHGTRQRIEGGLPVGARVVVVEDSMTTGGSALDAIEAVEEHGAVVVGVLALVDREEGGRARVEAEGHPFHAVFSGPELREAAAAGRAADGGDDGNDDGNDDGEGDAHAGPPGVDGGD